MLSNTFGGILARVSGYLFDSSQVILAIDWLTWCAWVLVLLAISFEFCGEASRTSAHRN